MDKLNIGIVGYGRMGHMVEEHALGQGHRIAFIANAAQDDWSAADVIIEFTTPDTVELNITKALDMQVPIVTGTTGWHERREQVFTEVDRKSGTLFHASNFSIGVNLFFMANEYLAGLMSTFEEYTCSVEETHHLAKLDSPSGTAITAAEGIVGHHKSYQSWDETSRPSAGELGIIAHRAQGVVGDHQVHYRSTIDQLSLCHSANDRTGFAKGALLAADFIQGKKGIHTMRDLLAIMTKSMTT